MSSKKKAAAVQEALEKLIGQARNLTLTSQFLKKWHEATKAIGGALSADRIEQALKNLGVKIIGIEKCAKEYIASRGWNLQLSITGKRGPISIATNNGDVTSGTFLETRCDYQRNVG